MQVQIDWNQNKIIAYGETLLTASGDLNPVYDGAPDDYSPEYYNWTPSVPGVFNANDFTLKVKFTKTELENRFQKLIDANYYMSNEVTASQFTTWLSDTRTQQTDFPRGSTSLISYINTNFFDGNLTKPQYTTARKTQILNILN